MRSILLLLVYFYIPVSYAQIPKEVLQDHCDAYMHEIITDPLEFQKCRIGLIDPSARNHNTWLNNPELKQSLDSTVTEYANNGTWIKYHLTGYSYNQKGYNTQSIHHDLNEEEIDLIPRYKHDFFFDDAGNVISINDSRRDEITGEWTFHSKREYTYDDDKNLTAVIMYSRNVGNTDWVPFHKVEYVYDGNGKIIEGKNYGWSELEQEWEMSTKEDFIYDDNDFLIERVSYFTGFDEWLNYRRSEFINDVNGNILQKTTYKSATGSDWIYDSREDREYNFIGLITKLIYVNYVDSTDQWVNDQRLDYVYDTYENLVESITLHWDTISGEWLSISKTELNYNLDFMLDDVLLPASWPEFGVAYDIRPLYKNLLVEVNYFSKNDAAWKNEDREIYYYGERDVSAISENPFIDINIYPNPVDDVISITGIDLSKPTLIKFFDLHGKLLLIQNIDENNRIDVSYLDQGLYICKINQDGRTTNHKILIK